MKTTTPAEDLQPLFDDSELVELSKEAKKEVEEGKTISQDEVKERLGFKS